MGLIHIFYQLFISYISVGVCSTTKISKGRFSVERRRFCQIREPWRLWLAAVELRGPHWATIARHVRGWYIDTHKHRACVSECCLVLDLVFIYRNQIKSISPPHHISFKFVHLYITTLFGVDVEEPGFKCMYHGTLQWRHKERWRLKSPTSRLFNKPFIQGTDQRKHQSSASLAFVRGIHPWQVT